jgi:hypothetical protein
LFEFGTGDDIAPVIERLAVYPLSTSTTINGRKSAFRTAVSGGHGNYYIPSEKEIRISGPAGFGIKSYDLLNDSYNRCAVYSIELRIDSLTKYRYVMDQFSFSETKYINAHIDYETLQKEKAFYQRTFVLPNDRLSVYSDLNERGIFNFSDNMEHQIEIILTDVHNNRSVLQFRVAGSSPATNSTAAEWQENGYVPMPYNRINRFRSDNITLTIPAGTLYDTLWFSYTKKPGNSLIYSDIHHIHNQYTPVHKPYSLSIKPENVPSGKESKLLIIQTDSDSRKVSVGGTWADGYVTASPASFGMFCVGIDTVSPSISANGLKPGADLSGRKDISIRITDDLSGIKSYEGIIDGKWALFEYDPRNNLLVYRFDGERITRGAIHSLTLKVCDNRDNESIFHSDFKW